MATFGHERCDVRVNELRVDAIVDKGRVLQHVLQEPQVGGHAFDTELRQRTIGATDAFAEIRTGRVDDDFREQRIVPRARAIAGVAKRINAHVRTRRRREGGQLAASGLRAAVRQHRFHVHAQLQRVATRRWNVLLQQIQLGKLRAGRKLQLRTHQVDACHLFGDGVLDLQAGVRFDERELRIVTAVGGHQEFESA